MSALTTFDITELTSDAGRCFVQMILTSAVNTKAHTIKLVREGDEVSYGINGNGQDKLLLKTSKSLFNKADGIMLNLLGKTADPGTPGKVEGSFEAARDTDAITVHYDRTSTENGAEVVLRLEVRPGAAQKRETPAFDISASSEDDFTKEIQLVLALGIELRATDVAFVREGEKGFHTYRINGKTMPRTPMDPEQVDRIDTFFGALLLRPDADRAHVVTVDFNLGTGAGPKKARYQRTPTPTGFAVTVALPAMAAAA